MTDSIDRAVSVKQLAKKVGWDYRRMLRHLKRVDTELGGRLLSKRGKGRNTRYWTTQSALLRLDPDWAQHAKNSEGDVEALKEKVHDLEGLLGVAHRDIGDLKRSVTALERERRVRP